MKNLKLATVLVCSTLFFASCAKQPVENSTLIGNKVLKQSPVDETVYYYLKDGADFAKYSTVTVPKIGFEKKTVEGEQKAEAISPELKEQMSTYFTNSLTKSLNSVAVKNPGKDSLKLDISFQDINVAYDDLKFYNYIPVALVVKGIQRGTGSEDKNAQVAIAMRLTDNKTKELIALSVDAKKIENINNIKELKFEDVKPLLDEWTKRAKMRFEDFSNGRFKGFDK